MADQIDIKLQGLKQLYARLDRMPPAVQDQLRIFMARFTIQLRGMVQLKIAERFKSIGPLFRSMRSEMTEEIGSVTGRVYSEGVIYAAIQEYGGKTPPHLILPVNGKALAFLMPGRLGFSSGAIESALTIVKAVNHPGSLIPERSYARATLFDQRDAFAAGMRGAVAAGLATSQSVNV
jgi:hypothetical protein